MSFESETHEVSVSNLVYKMLWQTGVLKAKPIKSCRAQIQVDSVAVDMLIGKH